MKVSFKTSYISGNLYVATLSEADSLYFADEFISAVEALGGKCVVDDKTVVGLFPLPAIAIKTGTTLFTGYPTTDKKVLNAITDNGVVLLISDLIAKINSIQHWLVIDDEDKARFSNDLAANLKLVSERAVDKYAPTVAYQTYYMLTRCKFTYMPKDELIEFVVK